MRPKIAVRISGHNNNFGDVVGSAIARSLYGGPVIEIRGRCPPPVGTRTYLVAGSTIRKANRGAVIWGAGVLDFTDKNIERRLDVLCCRGKLTKHFLEGLGIGCPERTGDSVLIAPDVLGYPEKTREHRLGVIPHSNENADSYRSVFGDAAYVIDICSGVREVMSAVASCEYIASAALHGIVIADAMKIPAAWCCLREPRWPAKYDDYFSSVSTETWRPIRIGSCSTDSLVDAAVNRAKTVFVEDAKDALLKSCPWR